jgi:hypothetical protein
MHSEVLIISKKAEDLVFKRWSNAGWTQLPLPKLYGEYKLVLLFDLIPPLSSRRR